MNVKHVNSKLPALGGGDLRSGDGGGALSHLN